jgi:NAD(P)-dependent dehydrogenase (short-subunit alcohol dehydrogenase family)
MRTLCWLERNAERLDGKTVAITGATGGLGGALCRHLLSLGASLVLLDRNRTKSDALKAALEAELADVQIAQVTLDLSDIASVRSACEVLETMPIDVLIHNSGAYSIPRKTCDTGYDNVFQINFVSPYYMTRRLLPMLRARGGRVVAVGSIAHRYSRIDTQDVDFSNRTRASLVYGNAKRHLMYALWSLFEGETQASLAVTHPGISFTGITNHYPKLIFALIKHPMKIIFMSPKMASLSILAGLFTECKAGEWIGPRLFDIWGLPKKKTLRTSTPDEAKKIAEIAENIYLNVNK